MASRASVRLRSLYHRPEEEEQSVASWIQQLKSHRARKFEKTERRFGHFVVSTWQPVDEVPPTLELQNIKNKAIAGRGRGRGGRGGRAGGRGKRAAVCACARVRARTSYVLTPPRSRVHRTRPWARPRTTRETHR